MSVDNDALCSKDNVKDFIGISNFNPTDETLIENLIDRVTDMFERYCRRKFKQATYTEYHSPQSRDDKIFPKNYPINSVTSIHDDPDRAYGSDTLITASEYGIVDDVYVEWIDGAFSGGTNSVKIIYSGGYSTIPEDLSQACIEEVARRYKRRKDIDISQKTQPDGSATLLAGDLLDQTKTVLNLYKKRLV